MKNKGVFTLLKSIDFSASGRRWRRLVATARLYRIFFAFFVIGRLFGVIFFPSLLQSRPWEGAVLLAAFSLFCLASWSLAVDRCRKQKVGDAGPAPKQDEIRQFLMQNRQEQLYALQNQINPHFLFNTLDTIRGLALEKGEPDIANTVAAMASMFKYSMDYVSTRVTVNEELSHLKQYIQLQCLRFPNKFTIDQIFECDFDVLFKISIPKLTLQPIVENALKHGLGNIRSGGRIRLRFVLSDREFRIIISDNGSGVSDETAAALNRSFRIVQPEVTMKDTTRFGIALSNINLRIKYYFGEDYGLHMASTAGLGTEVTVILPAPNTET
jgi:two-component system sensor histidine kinase YesM